jgi:hypothetical protein
LHDGRVRNPFADLGNADVDKHEASLVQIRPTREPQ